MVLLLFWIDFCDTDKPLGKFEGQIVCKSVDPELQIIIRIHYYCYTPLNLVHKVVKVPALLMINILSLQSNSMLR